jgi:hypothetical protein
MKIPVAQAYGVGKNGGFGAGEVPESSKGLVMQGMFKVRNATILEIICLIS